MCQTPSPDRDLAQQATLTGAEISVQPAPAGLDPSHRAHPTGTSPSKSVGEEAGLAAVAAAMADSQRVIVELLKQSQSKQDEKGRLSFRQAPVDGRP